jgi:DNA invertase Pin-like site-specific DNA recombinase
MQHQISSGIGRPVADPFRAAQYLRKSTDYQQFSIELQSAANHAYAASRGITIVRTYADEGKSGLTVGGREALRQLLDDVQSGAADFEVILVYDVSRWGRFQDIDESGYYEYICKRAGIRVHYCAEQFVNDGSPFSVIIKNIKRAIAGEYSRELSVKTFNGQSRIVALGFWASGAPGYGLRRLLIDSNGVHKGILAPGEFKSIASDRVILIPGPPGEIATVRWIFNAFVRHRMTETEIAATLNRKGIKTDLGQSWDRNRVRIFASQRKIYGKQRMESEVVQAQESAYTQPTTSMAARGRRLRSNRRAFAV